MKYDLAKNIIKKNTKIVSANEIYMLHLFPLNFIRN